jgi:hypothetical protein
VRRLDSVSPSLHEIDEDDPKAAQIALLYSQYKAKIKQ